MSAMDSRYVTVSCPVGPRPTTLSPNSEIHDALEKASYHDSEARLLGELFNSHSRTVTLPPEVLSHIFLSQACAIFDDHLAKYQHGALNFSSYDQHSHLPTYSWTVVSRVCRHWRMVALDCPLLWTHIVLDERYPPHCVQAFVNRSQGLPLTLVVYAAQETHCAGCTGTFNTRANYRVAIDSLREILPRTRRLYVFIAKARCAEVWNALSGINDATELQALHIETMGVARYTPSDNERAIAVPNNLTAHLPARVNELVYKAVGLHWANDFLPSTLRHLVVTEYQYEEGADLGSLLAALRNMPHLESLDIDPVPPASREPRYKHVELPSLQRLRVALHSEASATLLTFLKIPATTSILLHAPPPDMHGEEFVALTESHKEALARAVRAILRTAVIYAISHADYDRWKTKSPLLCRLWAAEQDRVAHLSEQPWASIDKTPYKLGIVAPLDEPTMTAIFAALDLHEVRIVSLDDDSGERLRPSVENLRAAVNLSTFRVSREAALATCAILARWKRPPSPLENVEDDGEDRINYSDWVGLGNLGEEDELRLCAMVPTAHEDPDLPFPRLRHVEISQVDFPLSKDRRGSRGYTFSRMQWLPQGQYTFDVDGFLRCMRIRAAQGASGIARLSFVNCQCYERERLIPLLRTVPEVWWDGVRLQGDDVLN